MYMRSVTDKRLVLAIYGVLMVVVLFCGYSIFNDVRIRAATGVLKVSSTNKQAVISISRGGYQANYLGRGSAAAHLQPGQYLVMVSASGQSVTRLVQVVKQQTKQLTLNPGDSVPFPTASGINFSGISGLVSRGISATQATKVELAIFKFSPRVQEVNFDTSTSQTLIKNDGAGNGNNQFVISFVVSLDSKAYNATITYSGINDVQLLLINADGTVALNSNT
ncbi:MAG: hypothetical protein ABI221_03065 [Candidatus Saccharimonadales bacterium]